MRHCVELRRCDQSLARVRARVPLCGARQLPGTAAPQKIIIMIYMIYMIIMIIYHDHDEYATLSDAPVWDKATAWDSCC